jgi:hypothetical protein
MIAINPHCDTLDTNVKPINLREKYGHRFRIEYEPSYYAQYGPRARFEDPWLMLIPGKYGHIYPHDGSKLAVATNNRGSVAKRLMAMGCCEVHQDGDDGVTVLIDEADLPKVAPVVKLRTTRTLTPEQRERLVAAGAASRRNGVKI